jgi:hypothetical protein
MNETEKAVTGERTVARIRFESPSGQSLQKRFNMLVKYYSGVAQPAQWTAEEFKKSLIRNIEAGTIVVEIGQERGLA